MRFPVETRDPRQLTATVPMLARELARREPFGRPVVVFASSDKWVSVEHSEKPLPLVDPVVVQLTIEGWRDVERMTFDECYAKAATLARSLFRYDEMAWRL